MRAFLVALKFTTIGRGHLSTYNFLFLAGYSTNGTALLYTADMSHILRRDKSMHTYIYIVFLGKKGLNYVQIKVFL